MNAKAATAAAVALVALPASAAAAVTPSSASTGQTWKGSRITAHLPADQNGWVSGHELRTDGKITIDFPAINKAGGACLVGYGVYHDTGKAISTSHRGRTPKLVNGTRRCVSNVSTKRTVFTPARSSGARNFTRLYSGTYVLNGWEQTGFDYQHDWFIWITGGATHHPNAPRPGGAAIKIDNSHVTGRVDGNVTATKKYSKSPALTIHAAEKFSGVKALTCTDTVGGKTVATWHMTGLSRFPASVEAQVPGGYFPDHGASTITCTGENAVGARTVLGSKRMNLVPGATHLSMTVSADRKRVTAKSGHGDPAIYVPSTATVTISGTLKDSTGPVKNTAVVLAGKLTMNGKTTVTKHAHTNASGHFKFTVKGSASRVFSVSAAAGKYLGASRAGAFVRTSTTTTLSVPKTITSGKSVTFSGQIRGGYVPSGGLQIRLEYKYRGASWATFRSGVYSSHSGRWSSTFPFGGTVGATYQLRAVVVPQKGWPYYAAGSGTVTRTLR